MLSCNICDKTYKKNLQLSRKLLFDLVGEEIYFYICTRYEQGSYSLAKEIPLFTILKIRSRL